jgi:hypothetical protein
MMRWNQISGIPLCGYSGVSYEIIIRGLVWLRTCLALAGRLGVEGMLPSKPAVGIRASLLSVLENAKYQNSAFLSSVVVRERTTYE